MHIQYERISTLKIKYGHLIVETEALWKNKRRKVQEINLDKGVRYQGVYYSGLCGYGVVFENERIITRGGWYYGNEKLGIEKYGKYYNEIDHPAIADARKVTPKEYEIIYSLYPDFKYTVKKMKYECNITNILSILKRWIAHPKEVEMLYAVGYERFIYSKSIYTLQKESKDRLIKFLIKMQKIGKFGLNYNECRQYAKIKDFDTEYIEYSGGMPYDVFIKRCKGKDDDTKQYWRWHYKDYIRLAEEQGHNIKEDYWKYPKDLKEAHDKLMDAKTKIEAAKKKEEFKTLLKRIKKYLKYNAEIDGYSIFFSAKYEEWKEQADTLHQCILASAYYKNRNCILAFIRKGNNPIATVEIKKNKEIGQFYANEWDRTNCHPSEEVKKVFYKWFENVKVGARL